MSGIFSELTKAKPAEETITLAGQTILARGLFRSKRHEAQLDATAPNGDIDNNRFESTLLALCCLDPKTEQPIQIDYREWDLAEHIIEPLVRVVQRVNGLVDTSEADVKKSDTTAN